MVTCPYKVNNLTRFNRIYNLLVFEQFVLCKWIFVFVNNIGECASSWQIMIQHIVWLSRRWFPILWAIIAKISWNFAVTYVTLSIPYSEKKATSQMRSIWNHRDEVVYSIQVTACYRPKVCIIQSVPCLYDPDHACRCCEPGSVRRWCGLKHVTDRRPNYNCMLSCWHGLSL